MLGIGIIMRGLPDKPFFVAICIFSVPGLPMSQKAIIVHGHFYQPPREDPLTTVIPDEPGAAPYRNWNERIHAECYRPNAELGNFQQISFNIGPTLLHWMDGYDPVTVRQITAQDRSNQQAFGVGNAMAQAYHHTILPLASSSDKIIQIQWGIADFVHCFGRRPQGMWLPETAVDYETLSVLANMGIEFTILAPWQADAHDLDLTIPYLVELPGKRSITVFFYQGELSARVSFDASATENADRFLEAELWPKYSSSDRQQPQLLVLATDGELYGHHKPFREQFLSHLLNGSSARRGITRTFPALWLMEHPARQRTGLREGTSWSCHHGIARWREECACSPLDGSWKKRLRLSLERLASELDELYFETVYPLVSRPRLLRQHYIHVMLGETSAEALITEMAGRSLTTQQVLRIHLMLESQRERQRMFTSCGWFFDDFDRIEAKNNLAYAAQATRLARIATGADLSSQTASDLRRVVSPRSGLRADAIFNHHLNRTWVMGRFD